MPLQFSYPTSFLRFAHRMINLMKLEDAFWIIVGLVRHYPRVWCVGQSSLLSDTKSNFRYECTVLKAAVEHQHPAVMNKLRSLGLPLETLVYSSVTSLYSDNFHSDILLRIWDLTIFYINTIDAENKQRGAHMLLAPALLIIKKREKEILAAHTVG